MIISFKIVMMCLILSFTSQYALSQELKKVKNYPLPGITEEFFVLKENCDIKEGPYKLKINNVIYQEGFYKNNERSGNWQVFHSKNVLDFKYNYDTKKLTCVNKRLYENPNDSTSHIPIYLGGDYYLIYKVSNMTMTPLYSLHDIKAGQYKSTVTFYIDTLGIPRNFRILRSSNNSQLDFEAVYNVMTAATSDFSYLPGSSRGKKVVMLEAIPVNFTIK